MSFKKNIKKFLYLLFVTAQVVFVIAAFLFVAVALMIIYSIAHGTGGLTERFIGIVQH